MRRQLVCLALLIAGIALVAWAESGGRNDRDRYEFFGDRSEHVGAEVAGIKVGTPSDVSLYILPELKSADSVATATVRFTTASGLEIETESACPTRRRYAPRVGSTVEVVYDRDQPTHACLADGLGFKEGHYGVVWVWGLGGVMAVGAIVVSVRDYLLVRKYGEDEIFPAR